jgi:amino acid permease
VTLNIGRDLLYHETHYGLYWKVLAAFGIICNLQVTCPLVTFAIRDMTAKIINIHPSEGNQRLIVMAILCTVTPIALTLSGNFATVCSLIGSFATIANSVLLPMIFYHSVHAGKIGVGKMVLHSVIVLIAVAATLVGIYANFSALLA